MQNKNWRTIIIALLFALTLNGMAWAQTSSRVPAAYQTYENGFMLWRGDTGTIYVLRNNGTYFSYFESYYATFPDNPVPEEPPSGLVKPIRGFGRVWGTSWGVREYFGWATGSEVPYQTIITPPQEYIEGIFTMTLPDGRTIRLDGQNATWGYIADQPLGVVTPVSSLPPSTAINANIQYYEGGFMIYWRETGSIWVFYDDGITREFPSETYGQLPEPPFRQAPAGLVRPIMGFGKVWGNFSSVRRKLGWATTLEDGYIATFQRQYTPGRGITLITSLPDGAALIIQDTNTWQIRR